MELPYRPLFLCLLEDDLRLKIEEERACKSGREKNREKREEKNEKSEKQRENGRYLVPDFKRDSLLRRTGASLFRVFLVKRRGFVKERREVEPSKGEEEYVTCFNVGIEKEQRRGVGWKGGIKKALPWVSGLCLKRRSG